MEYISPEENDLFTKALRFLYARYLEKHGKEAEITISRIDPEDPASANAA